MQKIEKTNILNLSLKLYTINLHNTIMEDLFIHNTFTHDIYANKSSETAFDVQKETNNVKSSENIDDVQKENISSETTNDVQKDKCLLSFEIVSNTICQKMTKTKEDEEIIKKLNKIIEYQVEHQYAYYCKLISKLTLENYDAVIFNEAITIPYLYYMKSLSIIYILTRDYCSTTINSKNSDTITYNKLRENIINDITSKKFTDYFFNSEWTLELDKHYESIVSNDENTPYLTTFNATILGGLSVFAISLYLLMKRYK